MSNNDAEQLRRERDIANDVADVRAELPQLRQDVEQLIAENRRLSRNIDESLTENRRMQDELDCLIAENTRLRSIIHAMLAFLTTVSPHKASELRVEGDAQTLLSLLDVCERSGVQVPAGKRLRKELQEA